MDDFLSKTEIKRRIVSSFFSLTARQIALRAFGFFTLNVILAKVLPVETLGIFNIAAGLITFFAFFSDIGLAASLIQKKDRVTKEDITTTFTIQTVIVGILSILIVVLAPILGQIYHLNEDGVLLVRIMGLAFFLSSLKVVPSVLLERGLRFHPLVIVEIVETIIFNGLLIVLTFNNFGINSFSIAAFFRGIIGVLLIYIFYPTKVGFGIDRPSAKKLLEFGIPFQLNSLLSVLKDRLVPLVVATMIGPVGVGYVTWAQSMAFLPLEFMNVIIRIMFPAFSRLQGDKKLLAKAVEKTLFVMTLVIYPLLFGLAAILPSVISYVVSPKWLPALSSFYLFFFSCFWAVISTTLTNTLNAIGHIKITLKLMVFWTLLTWVLTPALVIIYGFLGVGMSSFLISFSSVVTILIVKRILVVKILDSIVMPTLASGFMGLIIYIYSVYFVKDKLSLFLAIILGGFIYIGLILLFAKNRIIEDIKQMRNG